SDLRDRRRIAQRRAPSSVRGFPRRRRHPQRLLPTLAAPAGEGAHAPSVSGGAIRRRTALGATIVPRPSRASPRRVRAVASSERCEGTCKKRTGRTGIMITLYHHGSSVCAAKVRLVLAEKSVPWEGIYVDILRGDQF